MDTITKRILLLRHGTTACNGGDRLPGGSDLRNGTSHLVAGA